MNLEELIGYRDLLIKQLSDEDFIESSTSHAYQTNVQKLTRCLLEIKEKSKKIKQFQGEYRWLSNFWECEIKYKGETYPSNENFYQAMKTTDKELRKEFTKISPAEAKQKSKEIVVRENWDSLKEKVMLYGLRQKFKVPRLKANLIDTKDMVIEEGNLWKDTFWGIDLKTGEGENRLGKLIMKIRSEIMKDLEA